jgi:hypothetical protein
MFGFAPKGQGAPRKINDPFARMLGSPKKIMANLGNAPARKRTPPRTPEWKKVQRKRNANAAAAASAAARRAANYRRNRAASAERKRAAASAERKHKGFSVAEIRNITAELARKGYKQIKVTDGRGRQYVSGMRAR